ncbi:protein ligase RNF181 [Seminavis robusta]|uniref:Protein ligase RNF181 n=1 Tax=Seminavis robusta TaxID=568900 RepID=A0A9N8DFL7_9STRA|nr:protein ligase RNF181 [Seminavis robusta]|eukprot:Sro126_g060610.1 protein ligase RNF181 (677) ;mRNA; f:85057-87255
MRSSFFGGRNGEEQQSQDSNAPTGSTNNSGPTNPVMDFLRQSFSGGAGSDGATEQQGANDTSQQANNNNNETHQHPLMEFFRQNFGGGPDAAAAAAAQFGEFTEGLASHIPAMQQPVQQQQGPTGPPPASATALRQLPTISVTAADLVDASNRECCICFEENNIHDKVVRLPCAHIFHSDCITDWLNRHCTCPTCRYELATNDPMYEAGRRERMKNRKPRYAKYELKRMSIKELKALLPRQRRSSAMFSDKTDLIDYVISSGTVDLISAPPPVEFPSLTFLRSMGAGKLKRTMNETGVYFDPRDVVEKEDMLQLFVNSGRICLTEQTEDDSGGPDTTYGHAPCTRQRRHSYDDDASLESDDNNRQTMNGQSAKAPRATVLVETVGTYSDDEYSRDGTDTNQENTTQEDWDFSFVMEDQSTTAASAAERSIEVERTVEEQDVVFEADAAPAADDTNERADDNANNNDPMDVETVETAEEEEDSVSVLTGSSATSVSSAAAETTTSNVGIDDSDSQRKRQRVQANEEPKQEESPAAQFAGLSISQLRSLAREQGVDISRCIERSEMIERLTSQSSGNGASLDPDIFQSWTISHLRAVGNEVSVSYGPGASHHDMVKALMAAAAERPPVARYVKALSPLMSMSLSELRALARQWQIDVHDCLEKGEIIRRLAASAANRG